jgi:hypothetical protein
VLETVASAILDASEGGKGTVTVGDSNIAIGDVEDSVPEDVAVTKTDKGIIMSVENKRLDLNVKAVTLALAAR